MSLVKMVSSRLDNAAAMDMNAVHKKKVGAYLGASRHGDGRGLSNPDIIEPTTKAKIMVV